MLNLIGTFCIVNENFRWEMPHEVINLIGTFCIVNTLTQCYLPQPQTTYIVYHFSSFLSIPIFSYIFIKNFFLSFYKTIKKSNKNRYYRKSVDVLAFYCYYRSTDFI